MLKDRIKALREGLGLSRKEFALKFGIPRDTLRKLEQGHMLCPKPTFLRRLAAALGVEPLALFRDPDKPSDFDVQEADQETPGSP